MATKTKTTKKKTTASKKKAVETKLTHVLILLDRSGSMGCIRNETIVGINEQLSALRDGDTNENPFKLSILQFDDRFDFVTDHISPREIDDWTFDMFQPRGGTALRDALWQGIEHLKSQESADNTAYLVCVISDGGENASREISETQLAAEIKRLQDLGTWTFTYMLANQDIRQVAQTYYVPDGNISSFTHGAVSASYSANSAGLRDYTTTRSLGGSATANFYTSTLEHKTTT